MTGELFDTLLGMASAAAGAGAHTLAKLVRGHDQTVYKRGRADGIDAEKLRDELWTEINALRRRIDDMSAALEASRLAYIELMGKYTELRAEHKSLEQQHAEVKIELDRLTGS